MAVPPIIDYSNLTIDAVQFDRDINRMISGFSIVITSKWIVYAGTFKFSSENEDVFMSIIWDFLMNTLVLNKVCVGASLSVKYVVWYEWCMFVLFKYMCQVTLFDNWCMNSLSADMNYSQLTE